MRHAQTLPFRIGHSRFFRADKQRIIRHRLSRFTDKESRTLRPVSALIYRLYRKNGLPSFLRPLERLLLRHQRHTLKSDPNP